MTKKERNIMRIEEELKEVESKPLTWNCLDQLLNVLAEAMNVLGSKDFLQWADELNYSQSIIRDYFTLGAMRKSFEGKVAPGKAFAILFHNWSIVPLSID